MKTQKNSTARRNTKIILTTAIILIALSNTPPAQYFLLESYRYTNHDKRFQCSEQPGSGMDYTACQLQFQGWRQNNPNSPHQTLYRTFSIRPWQFWEWWQYLAHRKRFQLPYLDP